MTENFEDDFYVDPELERFLDALSALILAHEPFKSMGYISLEGESLEIPDPVPFARAAALADNLEVYPLASGRVRLTLTFLGLTTPIE